MDFPQPYKTKIRITFLTVLFFFVIEYVDYKLGPQMTVAVLHLIPLYLLVWQFNLAAGLIYSGMCSITIMIINLQSHIAISPYVLVWFNTVTDLIFFITFCIILNKLKNEFQEVKFLSERDGLTLLLNTVSFVKQAEKEVAESYQTKHPITLLFFDIDNFKQLNDRSGHQAGDEVLKAVGEALNNKFRKTDLRARMGGDEFAILLPGACGEEGRKMVAKFHEDMTELLQLKQPGLTISLGAVTFQTPPKSFADILLVVDKLMYEVKNSGKNKFLHQVRP